MRIFKTTTVILVRSWLLKFFTVLIVFWNLTSTAYAAKFDKNHLNLCFHVQSQKYLNGYLSLMDEAVKTGLMPNNVNKVSYTFAHEISYASGEGSLGAHYIIKEYKLNTGSAIAEISFSPNKGFQIEESLYILDNERKVKSTLKTAFSYDNECLLTERDGVERFTTDDSYYVFLGDFPLTNPLKVNVQKIPIIIDNSNSEVIFTPIRYINLESDMMTYSGYSAVIKGQPFKSEYYESQSGRKVSLFYLGGVINRKIETISKNQWVKENLNESIRVVDIDDNEIFSSNLRLRLIGRGEAPIISNKDNYFQTLSATRKLGKWQMDIEYKNEVLPSSIPWSTPPAIDELPYLVDTPSIHKQAVWEIANRLKTELGSSNRIEAARAINKEIKKILKYNPNTMTNATTEDILKKKDGICFHYSILFSSIARALNIPTKSVGGIIPRSGGMVAHAWNEIKINQNTWFPIEPQSEDTRPFQRGYIPTEDFSDVTNPLRSGANPEYLLEPTVPKNPYAITEIKKL